MNPRTISRITDHQAIADKSCEPINRRSSFTAAAAGWLATLLSSGLLDVVGAGQDHRVLGGNQVANALHRLGATGQPRGKHR
jgi:hypothetical protein